MPARAGTAPVRLSAPWPRAVNQEPTGPAGPPPARSVRLGITRPDRHRRAASSAQRTTSVNSWEQASAGSVGLARTTWFRAAVHASLAVCRVIYPKTSLCCSLTRVLGITKPDRLGTGHHSIPTPASLLVWVVSLSPTGEACSSLPTNLLPVGTSLVAYRSGMLALRVGTI